MTRHLSSLMALLVIACGASSASAQAIGYGGNRFSTKSPANPAARPPVSPYVNLLRSNTPVMNYYGLVRPEVEAREAETRLQGGLQDLDDRVRRQGPSTPSHLGISGHSAQFMTDLRGRPETLPIEMQTRRMRRIEQTQRTGLATPSTGHSSYFGNNGTFYRPPQ